jgi:hypothetical protein
VYKTGSTGPAAFLVIYQWFTRKFIWFS